GRVLVRAVVLVDDPRAHGVAAVVIERAARARAGRGAAVVDRPWEGRTVAAVLVAEAGGRVGRARVGLTGEADRRRRALADRPVARQRRGRGDVVHVHAEGVRPVEEGPVFIDQVDGDVVVVRAVGVRVALRAGAGVRVALTVAPVDDVAGHGVGAGIGHRAEREAVRGAFVHARVAGDRDRGRDVVDGHDLRRSVSGGG